MQILDKDLVFLVSFVFYTEKKLQLGSDAYNTKK